jgi:hypothetical protein
MKLVLVAAAALAAAGCGDDEGRRRSRHSRLADIVSCERPDLWPQAIASAMTGGTSRAAPTFRRIATPRSPRGRPERGRAGG